VDYIDDDQITSCGKLNFYAHAKAGPIDDQTLLPINSTRRFPPPASSVAKPCIDHAPYSGSAVRIFLFVYTEGKTGEDMPKVIKQWG
jgi:hypothetical protein